MHCSSKMLADFHMANTLPKQSAASICVEVELITGVMGWKVTVESQRSCYLDTILPIASVVDRVESVSEAKLHFVLAAGVAVSAIVVDVKIVSCNMTYSNMELKRPGCARIAGALPISCRRRH